MFLQVDPYASAESRVVVQDADDCTRLHIESIAPNGSIVDDDMITSTLTELGAAIAGDSPGRLWIDVAWLEASAWAAGVNAGWRARFAAMLVYSRQHGWLDDQTGALSAHIERPSSVSTGTSRPVTTRRSHIPGGIR